MHSPRAAFTFVTLFFAYASTGTGTQGWVTISVAGVSCPCVLASPLVYTDSTGKTWTVAASQNGTDMLVSSNFAGGSSASKGISLSQGSLLWLQLQFDAIPVGAAQVGSFPVFFPLQSLAPSFRRAWWILTRLILVASSTLSAWTGISQVPGCHQW